MLVAGIKDLFADTAAILISIVSNSHYGMSRGQIHNNLPPEHPIMSFETIEIKMANLVPRVSLLCLLMSLRTTTLGGREEKPWERGCKMAAVSAKRSIILACSRLSDSGENENNCV